MGRRLTRVAGSLRDWFGNIWLAVVTVAQALWVTIRYWVITYDPKRRTFTEHYEYPELPLQVSPRYRGFHRYDLTTCIACDRCAKDCPVNCIYIGKERATGRKGFKVTSFTIDYTKCMFCALCTEPCPTDCIHMGKLHDLSSYSREDVVVEFTELDKKGLRTPIPLWMTRNSAKIPWVKEEYERVKAGKLATSAADIPTVK